MGGRRAGWIVVGLLGVGCYSGRQDAELSTTGDPASEADGGGDDAGGADGADSGDDGPQAQCAPPSGRIWKLTPRQWDRTTRAVLGELVAGQGLLEETLPLDNRLFHNEADHNDMAVAHVDALFGLAEDVGEAVAVDPSVVDPCLATPGAVGDDACLPGAVASLLERAYRRPPGDEEVDGLVARIRAQATVDPEATAVGDAVAGVLMSPSFLYRTELGPDDAEGTFELGPYERASALSYFLLDGPPDDALLQAAADGALDDREGLEDHARRLLEDPAALDGLLRFFVEHTQTYRVTNVGKDPAMFPEFDAAMAADMQHEVEAFVGHVLGEDDGRFETLFTAPYSVINPRLAGLYGVQTESEDWAKVELPSGERAGLLTQPAWLTTLGYSTYGDPVVRGKVIRERFLCTPLPPPPPDISPIPEDDGEGTMRDRLAQHREDPSCAGCHQMMDPLGLPLERYDAIGRFRTHEGELEIDPSGTLHGYAEEVHFDDAIDMAHALAVHPAVRECFVEQLFFYAYGRSPEDADQCEVQRLQADFEETDGDVVELVVDIVTSDHFIQRESAQ